MTKLLKKAFRFICIEIITMNQRNKMQKKLVATFVVDDKQRGSSKAILNEPRISR